METVTISKKEYEDLKRKAYLAELEKRADPAIVRAMKDLEEGRAHEVKIRPKNQ